MAKNSNNRRNIAIASTAITVLFLAIVGGVLIVFNQSSDSTATRISLSIQNQIYALQGDYSRIKIGVNSIGKAENISLSAQVSLSNITCTFRPLTGMSNFTSILDVDVPDSTPTGNYTITVMASGSGHDANASLILSVLNTEKVIVSGIISSASLSDSPISFPYGIHFINIQTGAEKYVDLMGYYPFNITSPDYPFVLVNHPEHHYSVNLANGQSYNVVLGYYYGSQGNMSVTEESVGNFTVHALAGKTDIQKNFP